MTAGFAKLFKQEMHLKGAEKKRDGEKPSASPVSGGKVWSRRGGGGGAKLDPNICIRVWRRGPRYQLLCLSHSLYRDELLPGCHHGVPPSPWKLRKHSISRGSRRTEADYYYYHCHGREFLFRRGCGTLGNPSVFKDGSVRMQHFTCVCLLVCWFVFLQPRVNCDGPGLVAEHLAAAAAATLVAQRKWRRLGKFKPVVLNHPHG